MIGNYFIHINGTSSIIVLRYQRGNQKHKVKNIMLKRQTIVDLALHRKLKIEQHGTKNMKTCNLTTLNNTNSSKTSKK